MKNHVTIGRLAREAGLAAETLRYYERIGLIRPVQRTQSNYRLYDNEAEARLRFIRRAQNLGFSLAEVKELLDINSHPENDMAAVKQITQGKIADIEEKIADLERMRSALHEVSERCPGHGSVEACPILASLAGAERATDLPPAPAAQAR
ncbi:heavy metal-responsive transcriptional regulator [Acidithiobacillus sp. CV18-2]|uniref:Heavy metal-responsive transcriptional regulator n=1 Tax=Igneacidithiobacillus copahuensis TaxID=2724909 RepID=A0AAE2YNY0_9PROT|nr:heavy metal-responsive transcriptional regulator [Igneacidithiobacillus copahuensis]MBU2755805.1 heavy metal-responsive transcriptional regulator [Acidithiobacillus sp. CV18-3]MBU2756280.1 heavy metal-responsive transcriptional regulator [Acidithiobacillus sp. BN09-2]MBU2777787.1 heavy metal-responsive transcriptional regulator [Acidithiobacillus sp. CV18-2]MBU2795971.1 heavy metal-responsive transcriptional regulator [Acidithiobacillus sp. VAN18-2]MBU2800509.1 heavy metal-responsive transc